MTIVQPSRNNIRTRLLFFALIVIVGSAVFATVSLYNKNVALGHAIEQSEAILHQLQLENSDLKNKVLQIVQSPEAVALLHEEGLVKDDTPEYLNAGTQWPVATHSQ